MYHVLMLSNILASRFSPHFRQKFLESRPDSNTLRKLASFTKDDKKTNTAKFRVTGKGVTTLLAIGCLDGTARSSLFLSCHKHAKTCKNPAICHQELGIVSNVNDFSATVAISTPSSEWRASIKAATFALSRNSRGTATGSTDSTVLRLLLLWGCISQICFCNKSTIHRCTMVYIGTVYTIYWFHQGKQVGFRHIEDSARTM